MRRVEGGEEAAEEDEAAAEEDTQKALGSRRHLAGP